MKPPPSQPYNYPHDHLGAGSSNSDKSSINSIDIGDDSKNNDSEDELYNGEVKEEEAVIEKKYEEDNRIDGDESESPLKSTVEETKSSASVDEEDDDVGEPVYISSVPPYVTSKDAFRRFLNTPPSSKREVYRAILKRSKSLLGSTYIFKMDQTYPYSAIDYEILAKRKLMPKSYLISLDAMDFKQSERLERSKWYLGKLKRKSAFELVLQDQGINPGRLIPHYMELEEEAKRQGDQTGKELDEEEKLAESLVQPRCELAVIVRQDDDDLNRVINVGIPTVFGTGSQAQMAMWQGMTHDAKLLHNAKALIERGVRNEMMKDRIMMFGGYEDNFDGMVGDTDWKGREILRSEKNFKLRLMNGRYPGIEKDPTSDYKDPGPFLKMSKVRKEEWLVTWNWPFTMLQSFGIALSRFDME